MVLPLRDRRSGLPTTYYLGQCSQQVTTLPTVPVTATSLGTDNLTICPFARPNEPYSLSPGLDADLLGTGYRGEYVHNHTGVRFVLGARRHDHAWTSPITSSIAVAATATGGVGFSSINGAAVATGSQPQVIQNNPATTGNTYVYKIRNTGSVSITSASIVIPGQDTDRHTARTAPDKHGWSRRRAARPRRSKSRVWERPTAARAR